MAIKYQRLHQFDGISYRTKDSAYWGNLNTFSYSSDQDLDVSYVQDLDTGATDSNLYLLYDNAFGNKYRFTTISGTGISDTSSVNRHVLDADGPVIDNLTGLMYMRDSGWSDGTWNSYIDTVGTFSYYDAENGVTYSQWYPMQSNNFKSLLNHNYSNMFDPGVDNIPFVPDASNREYFLGQTRNTDGFEYQFISDDGNNTHDDKIQTSGSSGGFMCFTIWA